ncbi:MAG: hypothetical protein HY561_03025 [Gemmatimonadetes bacterium]|nr:hypothetical protein [Gemmatimonadota bacterium]
MSGKDRLSAGRGDFAEVLERVLTKGLVFDIDESAVGPSKAGESFASWFRLSVAGVDVFKIEAGVRWRQLLESEEGQEKKEG